MDLKQVKSLAAKVFKVGTARVKIADSEKAAGAITRDDVRQLEREKAIVIKPKVGNSRGRARVLKQKKKDGKRSGRGSRRGTKKTRQGKKMQWKRKVRAQRKKLRELKPEGYRKYYGRVKAGYFRSVKHLESAIRGE